MWPSNGALPHPNTVARVSNRVSDARFAAGSVFRRATTRKVSREVMALEYLDRTRQWVENTQNRLKTENVRAHVVCSVVPCQVAD